MRTLSDLRLTWLQPSTDSEGKAERQLVGGQFINIIS